MLYWLVRLLVDESLYKLEYLNRLFQKDYSYFAYFDDSPPTLRAHNIFL